MHRFLRTLSFIVTLLVGAVAVFILGALVPIDGNYTFRIVQSGSMEPTIRTGSVIATIPRNTYTAGDIVTFTGTEINPMPTTHRITGVEERQGGTVFITKGDANEDEDYRRILHEEILGKVFLSVPYVGYMSSFFGTPTGKATLVSIVVTALILMFTPWDSILAVKRKDEHER